jgi:hypothetical protein
LGSVSGSLRQAESRSVKPIKLLYQGYDFFQPRKIDGLS